MTIPEILREHALYHHTAQYWNLPHGKRGDQAFDALMKLVQPWALDSVKADPMIRRMFLLLVAEVLESEG